MAEDSYQPMDYIAEALSRLLHPSGIVRDPALVEATQAIAFAVLAAVSRLHVIAYHGHFEYAAEQAGLTVADVAEDPQAAVEKMAARRRATEEHLAAALDSLAEVRKLVEDPEHWVGHPKHGALIPLDDIVRALDGE